MQADFLPFNRASLEASDVEAALDVMRGSHLSGDGSATHRCHEFFETTFGVSKALLTTSCTHALEMAALLLEVGAGDEIIVPSFTFVSTVNAFVLRGCTPVFADVRPDTFNIDEAKLEALITPRTRAIVVVHYAGVACEMDEIAAIAARHGLAVVEDNAHGLFGKYRGRWLGTFGVLATQSFHETKNFTCGEGGALLVNEPGLAERSEILREKGTNRSRFFRGQVDKYTWVDLGSSYLPADVLAGMLLPQLQRWQEIQARRRAIWTTYAAGLREWAAETGTRLPTVPEHCEQAYHMFYLFLPSLSARQALIAHLKASNIGSAFHYQPLDRSPMGLRVGRTPTECSVTAEAGDRLLRLPFFTGLTESDQRRVIASISDFRP